MRGWIGVGFAIFLILGGLYILNNNTRTVSCFPVDGTIPTILVLLGVACFVLWIILPSKKP